MTDSNLHIVVGGCHGSEGKGGICGWLHSQHKYAWAARVGGPNAGHTVWKDGKRYALQQLPVAAVMDPACGLIIAAGSEVDLEILFREINEVQKGTGHEVGGRLIVDETATILTPEHGATEAAITTGTTGKGIGAARADRALRRAFLVGDLAEYQWNSETGSVARGDTQSMLRDAAAAGDMILIEGAQGYGLGTHAGAYPFVTSGDCRAIDAMAACGLPPMAAQVWVVLRTYPIRIAGNSGPLKNETSWSELGLEPEITTVTKKIRRIGEWDWELARQSVQANGGANVQIALTFVDYWDRELAGMHTTNTNLQPSCNHDSWSREQLSDLLRAQINEIEERLDAPVSVLGTGPYTYIKLEN